MNDLDIAESITATVCKSYLSLLMDLFEVEVEVLEDKVEVKERFNPSGNSVVQIDYIGSIVGLVAISASDSVFGRCFDMPSPTEKPDMDILDFHQELTGALKECMNTVAGKCLSLLAKKHSCITMLAPKVLFGNLSYPKTPCMERKLVTNIGEISFYFLVDNMKLETSKVIDKLETAEKSSKEVITSMSSLYEDMEAAQRQVLNDVGTSIKRIESLNEYIERACDDEMDGACELRDPDNRKITEGKAEVCAAVASLTHTQNLMGKRLADIVHDLNMYKGMLRHELRVTKVRESSHVREVSLSGFLTENANLAFFNDINSGQLVVNTKNFYNHTTEGLTLWLRIIGNCPDEVSITFVHCSEHFLSLSQQHSGFLGNGSIASVSAHYYCETCELKEEFELHLDHVEDDFGVPKVECSCSNEMVLWEGCDQSALLLFFGALCTFNAQDNTEGARPN